MTTLKTCFKCGIAKPRTSFYRHAQMGDGLLGKCKECTKIDVKANRIAKADYYRAFDRLRGSLPHRIESRKKYASTPIAKKLSAKAKRKWNAAHPDKRAAAIAVGNAVRDGRIKRHPCFVCGAANTEAHHPSYALKLDVVWLCEAHHRQVHKEAREYRQLHAGVHWEKG